MIINLSNISLIQSPFLYFQAAGSTGDDGSAEGIHLRWDLLRNLGALHIPKGDYAENNSGFNRMSGDYVKIYRCEYSEQFAITLNFETDRPLFVYDNYKLWIYKHVPTNTMLYVYFRNSNNYDTVRTGIDPVLNPWQFIMNYGFNLIEIYIKDKLFFSSEFKVEENGINPELRVETLSIKENLPPYDTLVSCRKRFVSDELCLKKNRAKPSRDKKSDEECKVRMVSENIKSIRFMPTDSVVKEVRFETYLDYILNVNIKNGWTYVGDFALTTDTNTAYNRLEDTANYIIHDRWQKFNDNALVNINNYKNRWINMSGGIKSGVEQYILLSETDPLATASLPGNNNIDGSMNVSYLELLKLVSMDFHVARMLGLGTINTDNIQSETTKYIYLAEYFTEGELDDGRGARSAQHIYLTVPTSKKNSRLPKSPTLLPVTYGLFADNGTNNPVQLTDDNGFSVDGKTRFINLFVQQEAEIESLGDFFVPPVEFCRGQNTASIFLGIEYKKNGELNWRKPEIAHDPYYYDTGNPSHLETSLIPFYSPQGRPNFIHRETEAGIHDYSSYSVNWFSRASLVNNTIVSTDETIFPVINSLIPPSNFHIQLIQVENPLMLTTTDEQNMLNSLSPSDKTLVRITFDYNHLHDLAYAFGDYIELFFRQEAPGIIQGALKSFQDDPADNKISVIRTKSYTYNSTGETISPILPPNMTVNNFKGGKFTVGQKQYTINDVITSNIIGEGPVFYVKKIREALAQGTGNGPNLINEIYTGPSVGDINNLFMAVENVNNPANWGSLNPLTKRISIGDASWTTRTEQYVNDDGTITQQLYRGVWDIVSIVAQPINGQQIYEVSFSSYVLQHHSQAAETEPVDWYNGVIRIPLASNPSIKKTLDVIKIVNINNGLLVLKVLDSTFPNDAIMTGSGIEVNFYPGYKIYLHNEDLKGFNEVNILPSSENSKTTYMGARTVDSMTIDQTSGDAYSSLIGQPHFMIAQKIIAPEQPLIPMGAKYATPPNYYDKSTYAFTVQFTHKPYATVFCRANQEDILKILYSSDPLKAVNVQKIKDDLALITDDTFFTTRWSELANTIYHANTNLYNEFLGYRFPLPNNEDYVIPESSDVRPFDGIRNFSDFLTVNYPDAPSIPFSMVEIIKNAILEAFVPLTEQPLIYEYIDNVPPTPQKQIIKDSNGHLISPNHPDFNQAPMAQLIGTNKILFVDYSLMGSGEDFYFYAAREIGNRMQIGNASPVCGPIQLINSSPAEAPKILKIYSRLYDEAQSLPAAAIIEIAGYSINQKISHIELYRTYSEVDALSVRSMQLAKSLDLEALNLLNAPVITIVDDFFGETNAPFGRKIYYKVVAIRKLEYENIDNIMVIDYAHSKPSDILITTIADNMNPVAPEIQFIYDTPIINPPNELTNVKLIWNKTSYNSTYTIYKMNTNGIWKRIKTVTTNDYNIEDNSHIEIDLLQTELGTNILPKQNEENESICHRFKIQVENSSGLFNIEEKPATI